MIDYVGTAGMDLLDTARHAKVQVNIRNNYQKAFLKEIRTYIKSRYSHLQIRSCKSYEEMINKSMSYASSEREGSNSD